MSELDMTLNRIPEKVQTVHLMGICGTGMGSLAGMLQEKGFVITGSDKAVYPPMSTLLASMGIPVSQGYGPENLRHDPDLVVVGNVITRQNEEARELARKRIPFVSFPQALKYFFLRSKTSLVVAGTHGKTTTASILASLLEHAGFDPGFMIGGIVQGFGRSYKLGRGPYFVVEGDEYDTAFFDKGPKFLHYQPQMAILTSVEFDHADIFSDLPAVKEAFRRLVRIVPPSGALVAYVDAEGVREVMDEARCPLIGYGEGDKHGQLWTVTDLVSAGRETRFSVHKGGALYGDFASPLVGKHNALNTVAVMAVLDLIGVPPATIQSGLSAFQGVRRRQEVRGVKNGITVIDDFAHHPTAVRETLVALRAAYPAERLVAVFEPRTNSSRRKIFQADYARSFDAADCILVREPVDLEKVPAGNRFSSSMLVDELKKRGKAAYYFSETDGIIDFLRGWAATGDVIAVMSNGGFDNIHERLLAIL